MSNLVPENAKTIYDFLVHAGLSKNAAAGILGNIMAESGGNPQAEESPGSMSSGYGLIQWTPGTHYFGGPASLSTQLEAILKYISGNGSISDINAHASSPSEAAQYFMQKYERPANDSSLGLRQSSAEAVAQEAAKGDLGNPVQGKVANTTSNGDGGSGSSDPATQTSPALNASLAADFQSPSYYRGINNPANASTNTTSGNAEDISFWSGAGGLADKAFQLTPLGSVLGGLPKLTSFLKFPGEFVTIADDIIKFFEPSNMVRVFSGIIGINLLILAIILFAMNTDTGSKVASTAGSAAMMVK